MKLHIFTSLYYIYIYSGYWVKLQYLPPKCIKRNSKVAENGRHCNKIILVPSLMIKSLWKGSAAAIFKSSDQFYIQFKHGAANIKSVVTLVTERNETTLKFDAPFSWVLVAHLYNRGSQGVSLKRLDNMHIETYRLMRSSAPSSVSGVYFVAFIQKRDNQQF